MTISLAFLAPDLVKAAIEGRLPRGIGIARLCDQPVEWSSQYLALGLANSSCVSTAIAVGPRQPDSQTSPNWSLLPANRVSCCGDQKTGKRNFAPRRQPVKNPLTTYPQSHGDEIRSAQPRKAREFEANASSTGDTGMNGGRTRARTWDPLIKSQLLYQLSYAPSVTPGGAPSRRGLAKPPRTVQQTCRFAAANENRRANPAASRGAASSGRLRAQPRSVATRAARQPLRRPCGGPPEDRPMRTSIAKRCFWPSSRVL